VQIPVCGWARAGVRLAFPAALALTAAASLTAQEAPAAPLAESAVEQRPQAVPGSCLSPTYPVQMRAARIEGRVVLQAVVDTIGQIEPSSIVVLQSTHQLFASAARRALLTCRYRPGRFGNRLVRVRIEAPYTFRIAGT
jgi:TonB family protein